MRAGARVVVAIAVALLAAPVAAATHTVLMDGFAFKPQTLEVKAGDRIEWVNRDIVPHTATASNHAFDSKAIEPGKRWAWTAGAPGQYAYDCTFHPNMKAVVQVR